LSVRTAEMSQTYHSEHAQG